MGRLYRTHHVSKLFRRSADAAAFLTEVDACDPPWMRNDVAAVDTNLGVKQDTFDLKLDEWADIYKMVEDYIQSANRLFWNFHLTGFQQPLRVARYTPGYFHDWHLDYMPGDGSKLALSCPLNTGWEGGEFEMLDVPKFYVPRGSAVVFPAFHGHRVTPVTNGVRYVLLAWFTGPRFR